MPTSCHTDAHAAARPGEDIFDVLVVGAGQAGLAVAYHLRRAGLRFMVIDAAGEVGASWRNRWDSLTLFTPAQYDDLPGMDFPTPAHTYPTRTQVADYLREYATRFDLSVQLDTQVTRLERHGDQFVAHTTRGRLRAHQVVVATGPFQTPVIPSIGVGLDRRVAQLHSAEYRNPTQLGPGRVLVVGAGNSGRQIALELAATHDVTLAVGSAPPRLPQRMLGRDLFWWLQKFRILHRRADSWLARRMRARGELVIGSRMSDLRSAGVDVRPRVVAGHADHVWFADHTALWPATVVWATGFRQDYALIDIPGVVIDGSVQHERGITTVPGLTFIGLSWQHTRGSALLGFVQHDAGWLAQRIHNHAAEAMPGRAAGTEGSADEPGGLRDVPQT